MKLGEKVIGSIAIAIACMMIVICTLFYPLFWIAERMVAMKNDCKPLRNDVYAFMAFLVGVCIIGALCAVLQAVFTNG